ncbi:hypothetical protein D3C84_624470 [compost metagenome]
MADDIAERVSQRQTAARAEHHQGADGLQVPRHAIFGFDAYRIQAALKQALLTAVHELQALPQPGFGKEAQPFPLRHRLGVGEFVIRHLIQGSDLAGQRGEGRLPQNGAHRPGELALCPAGIDPGRRFIVYGQHLAAIQRGNGAMALGGHIAGVELEGQLAIGIEHSHHAALAPLPLIPAQLPLAADTVVRRRPADDGNRRPELGIYARQHSLFLPGAGVQQDELRQLAGTPAIGDGAAQQLAHIQLVPCLTGHAVGPLVVIEGRHCQTPAQPAMMASLGQDTATGAAPDEPGLGKTGLERTAQYRGIVCLGKIDQQQRRGMR